MIFWRTIRVLSQQLIQVTGSGYCYQAPAEQVGGSGGGSVCSFVGDNGGQVPLSVLSGGGRWVNVTITPRAARAISFSSSTRARRIRIFRNERVAFLLFPFPKKAACHYQNKFNDLFYLFHLSVCLLNGLYRKSFVYFFGIKARTGTVIPQAEPLFLIVPCHNSGVHNRSMSFIRCTRFITEPFMFVPETATLSAVSYRRRSA